MPPRSVLAHFVPAHFGPLLEDPSGYRGIVIREFSIARVLVGLLTDVHFDPFYDT